MEGRRIYVKHPSYSNELYHYGTPGMSWHKRLYQYEDGSLTPLGRVHYGIGKARAKSKAAKEAKAKAKAEAQAAKDRAKAEAQAAKDRATYQNADGTLNRRGMVKYKTTDKYALMTDDEIRQQTQRLQLQKNFEDMKKQTSAGYRIANKLTSAVEDVLVAGYKKGAEKLVNHFVDEAISSVLNTDRDKTTKIREITEKLSNMTTSQIQEANKRRSAAQQMYKAETGEDLPKDFVVPDEPKNNQEQKPEAKTSEQKPEAKTSEQKPEQKQNVDNKPKNNTKPNESKKEASEPKSEDKSAESKPLMNKKNPSMKEVKDKPSVRIHRFNIQEKMEKAEKDTNRAERAYGINPARISSMHSSGMTIEEIAKKLNISTSTVQKYM